MSQMQLNLEYQSLVDQLPLKVRKDDEFFIQTIQTEMRVWNSLNGIRSTTKNKGIRAELKSQMDQSLVLIDMCIDTVNAHFDQHKSKAKRKTA